MSLKKTIPAIDAPLSGVQLIQASAGTGKTWTLSALFARLVLERGLEPKQILAITFTKAAAAELRDRIRKRLVETLAAVQRAADGQPVDDPFYTPLLARLTDHPTAVMRLKQALADFDLATITTIHGFCQGVLSEQALASGAPLDVEVITDTSPLLREIIQDFCRRQWRQADPLLVSYYLNTGVFSLGELQKFVQGVLNQGQARLEAGEAPGGESALVRGKQRLDDLQALWQQEQSAVRALLDGHGHMLNQQSYKPEQIRKGLNALDRFLRDPSAGLAEFIGSGSTAAKAFLKVVENFSTGKLQEKTGKNFKGQFPHHPLFDALQDLPEQLEDCREAIQRQSRVFRQQLAAYCQQTLTLRLQQQQAQNFDMQIKGLAQALDDAETGQVLAAALRARYPAALVDEFQDTDDAQYRILQAVYLNAAAADSVLFLVGDPKQAIYRFRGADVYTYLRAYDDVPDTAKHDLADNQRSVKPLIEALNAFFTQRTDAFRQEKITYTPVGKGAKPCAALLDRREGEGADAKPLRFLTPDGDCGNSKDDGVRWAIRATVNEIVRLLHGAQEDKLLLDGKPVQGRDIAILVRAHYQADQLRRELARAGVKAAMQSNEKVFASVEAEDMAHLLAAMAEPHHEGKVRAALATRLCGATVADFLRWQTDTAGWTEQLQRFQDYQQIWLRRGFMVAWREFLQRDGVVARVATLPGGERILTNLLHLAELLHEEDRQRDGQHHLCEWLAQQRRQPQDSANAELRLESDENLVKILTIHASKGLEYPIVFAPVLWTPPDPNRGTPFYHTPQGEAVFDLSEKLSDDNQKLLEDEVLSEDLRLGYVALTRAAQRCYVAWFPVDTTKSSVENSCLGHWLPNGEGGLHALQEQHPALIAVQRVGLDALQRLPARADRLPELRETPAPAVPGGWRVTSFSDLNNNSQPQAAALPAAPVAPADDTAADHDRDAPQPVLDPAPPLAELPLRFRFPHPARLPASVTGNCLHGLFEHLDFTRPVAQQTGEHGRPLMERQLQRYGLPTGNDSDSALPLDAVADWLDEVLATPLAPGLRLADIPRAHTLRELDFHLPLPALRTRALVDALRRAGLPVPELGDQTIRGFLKGSIDLVFRHEGRWYVADYKSNRLGHDYTAFGPQGLALAMAHGGYHLQAALYAVALHRWLQSRLRDYDPAVHLGGVYYLFIRGMHPAQGAHGVHAWHPPLELLDTLSHILAAEEATP